MHSPLIPPDSYTATASPGIAPQNFSPMKGGERGIVQRQIIFIDKSFHKVADRLLDGRSFEQENHLLSSIEGVLLDRGRNGIYQISDALLDRSNITDMHLIVPGAPGEIQLGSTLLNLKTIDSYIHEFPLWCDAFSPDAEIWIHCEAVAQSEEGQELIQRLNRFTQCMVYLAERGF